MVSSYLSPNYVTRDNKLRYERTYHKVRIIIVRTYVITSISYGILHEVVSICTKLAGYQWHIPGVISYTCCLCVSNDEVVVHLNLTIYNMTRIKTNLLHFNMNLSDVCCSHHLFHAQCVKSIRQRNISYAFWPVTRNALTNGNIYVYHCNKCFVVSLTTKLFIIFRR